MSNKLVKVNNEKRIITEHKKRTMLIVCLIVLSIAFVYVWINVFLNSNNFEEKMDNMVIENLSQSFSTEKRCMK